MNLQGVYGGRADTPLADEGRLQAKLAGSSAKHIVFDVIASSPLSRALHTAQIIAKEVGYPEGKIHTSSLLIERDFGSLEGTHYSPDINLDGFSDVESDHALIERAKLAVEWLKSLGGDVVLVVSHGALGRAMRTLFKPDTPFREYIRNAELHEWL